MESRTSMGERLLFVIKMEWCIPVIPMISDIIRKNMQMDWQHIWTQKEIVRDDAKLVVTRTSAYTGWTFVSFASRKELLQSVKAIKLLLYKIVLLSAVGALLLSRFLSGYMYRPLKSLISYMRKVRKGDFSVRIEEKEKMNSRRFIPALIVCLTN